MRVATVLVLAALAAAAAGDAPVQQEGAAEGPSTGTAPRPAALVAEPAPAVPEEPQEEDVSADVTLDKVASERIVLLVDGVEEAASTTPLEAVRPGDAAPTGEHAPPEEPGKQDKDGTDKEEEDVPLVKGLEEWKEEVLNKHHKLKAKGKGKAKGKTKSKRPKPNKRAQNATTPATDEETGSVSATGEAVPDNSAAADATPTDSSPPPSSSAAVDGEGAAPAPASASAPHPADDDGETPRKGDEAVVDAVAATHEQPDAPSPAETPKEENEASEKALEEEVDAATKKEQPEPQQPVPRPPASVAVDQQSPAVDASAEERTPAPTLSAHDDKSNSTTAAAAADDDDDRRKEKESGGEGEKPVTEDGEATTTKEQERDEGKDASTLKSKDDEGEEEDDEEEGDEEEEEEEEEEDNKGIELFNYASADAGAKIVATSPETKAAHTVLTHDADKYLMSPCNTRRWFTVQLSEEITVRKIVLSNLEHYSSSIKDFQLLGSPTHPTKKWIFLGNFRAQHVYERQTFKVKRRSWVRFLKVRMLSHHGSEYYCTLTTLEVYGNTMIESFRKDMETSTKEVNDLQDTILRAKGAGDDEEEEEEEDEEDEEEEEADGERRTAAAAPNNTDTRQEEVDSGADAVAGEKIVQQPSPNTDEQPSAQGDEPPAAANATAAPPTASDADSDGGTSPSPSPPASSSSVDDQEGGSGAGDAADDNDESCSDREEQWGVVSEPHTGGEPSADEPDGPAASSTTETPTPSRAGDDAPSHANATSGSESGVADSATPGNDTAPSSSSDASAPATAETRAGGNATAAKDEDEPSQERKRKRRRKKRSQRKRRRRRTDSEQQEEERQERERERRRREAQEEAQQQEQPGSGEGGARSVFNALADRIKVLEMNQSLSNHYIEELNKRVSRAVTAVKKDVDELSSEKMTALESRFEQLAHGVDALNRSTHARLDAIGEELRDVSRLLETLSTSSFYIELLFSVAVVGVVVLAVIDVVDKLVAALWRVLCCRRRPDSWLSL